MKKLFSFVVALVATVAAFAQQPVGVLSVAPKVGLNLASMTDAEDSKMRAGLVAGVDLTYQFSDLFALSGGLFYSQQGVKGNQFGDDGNVSITYADDYFNVPILANFYVAKGLALKTGVQPGALLSAKIKGKSAHESGSIDVKDGFNSFDLSIPVGLSYEIANVIIDARYNIGVLNTMKDAPVKPRNNVIAITVGYKFNL